jgi:hypothetical protein
MQQKSLKCPSRNATNFFPILHPTVLIKPGISGLISGVSGLQRPEFPDLYPEFPPEYPKSGVSGLIPGVFPRSIPNPEYLGYFPEYLGLTAFSPQKLKS